MRCAPVILGAGTRPFDGIGPDRFGLEQVDASHSTCSRRVTYRVMNPRQVELTRPERPDARVRWRWTSFS